MSEPIISSSFLIIIGGFLKSKINILEECVLIRAHSGPTPQLSNYRGANSKCLTELL